MARWSALWLMLLAGQGWAGDAGVDAPSDQAWVGVYRLRDHQGERSLVLVRSATQVEYRVPGQPVRLWRRTPDGPELHEIDPASKRDVVYAPGELRTLHAQPAWAQLAGLVAPDLRGSLTGQHKGRAFGQPLTRYRGRDAHGTRIELDWLPDAGLPVRYRLGKRGNGDAIVLLRLDRTPASQAFTTRAGLVEIDHADLGDEAEVAAGQGSHSTH